MKQVVQELFQKKKRMLITAGVLLVLNIALYALVTGYLEPAVIKSRSSWSALRQRLAVAGKVDVATVFRRGTDDLKKLMTRIPAKRDFPRVLGDILDAAATNAVVTGSVSYKPQDVKGQNLLAYGISMSVGGSYAALKSFLADLQKNSEMIVIDSMSISKSDLYEENLTLDLKLTVYLQGKEGA